MFDSPWEWLIVGLVIVLLFGSAKKIPEFSRNLGKATGEFKRGQAEIEREIKSYVNSPAPEIKDADLTNFAKSLGISTENKNLDQIRNEVANKLKSGH
ncbi:MAG: Sec-independent protein translocase subunit TatA/TatB [Thermoplasmataceae archaeon]